jgi:hypothetical protein
LHPDGVTPVALHGKSASEVDFRVRARGITPAGRGKIRLQWEVEPLGTPFDGHGLGLSPLRDTGAPAGGSAASIDGSVTGLSEGTFYHWRARIVSADPFFPRSPWRSIPGNNVTETKLRTSGCVDFDGDAWGGSGDPSCASPVADCDDGDDESWARPGPTADLRFTSRTTLVWSPPSSPGAVLSTLRYDTLRSGLASNFTVGDCIESIDGPNTTALDDAIPSAGSAFYYLTRARNGCPQGVGSLGTSSAGVERPGRNCP